MHELKPWLKLKCRSWISPTKMYDTTRRHLINVNKCRNFKEVVFNLQCRLYPLQEIHWEHTNTICRQTNTLLGVGTLVGCGDSSKTPNMVLIRNNEIWIERNFKCVEYVFQSSKPSIHYDVFCVSEFQICEKVTRHQKWP